MANKKTKLTLSGIAKKSIQNIINKIIKIGDVKESKTVLEIGSGYGSLTKKIVSMKPKKILAIENMFAMSVCGAIVVYNFPKRGKKTKEVPSLAVD